MKTDKTLFIRYLGPDSARRFAIQRGDFLFWTGRDWTEDLADALLFANHRMAQFACRVIQIRRHGGKPKRTYKCELVVTVTASDVAGLELAELVEYLRQTLRIDMEVGLTGDGPLDDSYVEATVRLAGLREVKPRRTKRA
jgi:hypothetical protein